ncbi:MAG: hypothetical protein Q9O74_09425 [Planctomycetota bacterium]|nr:hypothetical protein [Planctomycetota bacterium]
MLDPTPRANASRPPHDAHARRDGFDTPMERLEPRIVLDGDWSAADAASVFGSWGEGGYLTVTTIDLNNQPIVFERGPSSNGSGDDSGGSGSDSGSGVWQQLALLTTDDGTGNPADLDGLGRSSLAVEGDRMILGAPRANNGAGAAAVFRFQSSTQTWAFETLLDAPGLDAGDGFGWSVDLHGSTAVIGTRAGGAAYVYSGSSSDGPSGWTLQTTLEPAADQRARGGFGQAVATDGGTVVVGAPGEEGLDSDTSATSGAVYIYERNGRSWDVAVRMDAPQSARDSEFGHAVAVHSGSVIVGAWLDDDMGQDSGSVFAIGRNRDTWGVEAKLTPTSQAPGARFGHDVAASGSRAAAMALGAGDGSNAAFAQVFKRRGDRWTLEATLDAGTSTDTHWRSIAMEGDRVALGSDTGDGAVAIFRKIDPNDQWVLESTLTPSAEEGAMLLGHAVAIHEGTVLLGGLLAIGGTDGGQDAVVSAGAWVMGRSGGTGDDGTGHDHNDDHGSHDDDDHDDDHGNHDDDDHNDDHGHNDDGHDHGGNGSGDNNSGGDDNSNQSGRWIVRTLGTLPDVGTPVSDILTWTDPKDGLTYAAVATDSGLVLFTRSNDRSAWTSRDLTAETAGGERIVGDISVFGTRDGRVTIVGYTTDGDLVLYRQNGNGLSGAYEWTFQNISATDLTPRGFTTPRFVGNVVSFVTKWNALNIAGLDAQGRVQAVWTTPGMDQWRSDDLSASSGAPAMHGQLAVFLTPWGGINLAGTDDSGALNVTWWVPGFAKWVTSDFNALFDGPTLDSDSVSAYTTPWGGLNISGRNERGDLVVYWWTPQFKENGGEDRWLVANISEQITASEQPVGTLQGLVTPNGEINLFGTNAADDVIRYYWERGEHWKMENLTHTAVPV